MTERVFRAGLIALAALFTVLFVVIIGPEVRDGLGLGEVGDDMFANSSASGVSTDVLLTYAVLALWVVYEAATKKVRRGWIALVLGAVPGVTVGLAAYLLIRMRQVKES